MGIRVHKVLGYGLTDVECENYRISDARFNPASKFLDDERWEMKPDEYLDWLKARTEEREKASDFDAFNIDVYLLKEGTEKRDRLYMSDVFIHQREYGLPSVVLLKPLSFEDWRRYDDAIDYVEETYLRPDEERQINWVKELPHGIYPYSGIYMDRRTGERLKDPLETLWRRRYFSPNVTDETREDIAMAMGCATFEEADKTFGPLVPVEIRDLVEWGELFTDDTVWRQLRPMLYTYWS